MRSRHFLAKVSVFFFLALILIPISYAQTGTTSLHGTVTDKSHAVIAGAKITLLNSAQKFFA